MAVLAVFLPGDEGPGRELSTVNAGFKAVWAVLTVLTLMMFYTRNDRNEQ